MNKNVFVVDEQGNNYGATYPKRAKGLVKNGRARFIDENTICLACPPNVFLEENQMTEMDKTTETTTPAVEYSIPYVLAQIQLIREETQHLREAFEAIAALPEEPSGAVKAQALAVGVKCRETTNQQLIRFYEKIYEDLRPQQPDAKMDSLERLVCNLASVYDGSDLSEVIISLKELYK